MQLHIHFAPYTLEGGWNAERKTALQDAAISVLGGYMPSLKDSIVGSRLMTPVDLEEAYGTFEGHLHHGEHAADQLLIRPGPECARYQTPIEGVFLCGGGAHPGGGLTGAPGAFAARALHG